MKSCAYLIAILASSLVTFGSCSETGLPPDPIPDTTSHQITWDVTTLGDGGSGLLNDVAIVGDTLVYAVGELYLSGEATLYNLAVWDGGVWSIQRVPYLYQGRPFYSPIQTVLAFGRNDIWFAGNGVVHWDGQQYIPMEIPSSIWGADRINRIWGSTSINLYLCGNGGSVAQFVNGTWQKLASGTTLNITDVYGARPGSSGNLEILAVASEYLVSSNRRVMGISGTTVTTLSDSGISYSLMGVWFVPGEHYYAVGSGIYEKGSLQDPRWSNGPLDITTYHTYGVRGTAANDVFVCGDFGEILHYNGSTWQSYISQTGLSYGAYFALSIRGDLVVAVGENLGRAVVALGRRVK